MISNKELLNLKGKTAIVTGAAKGIGKSIAVRLAEAGANVVISDADGDGAVQTAKELSGKGFSASANTCDVSKETQVLALVKATLDAYGPPNILVNNAGIFPTMPVLNMQPDMFDKVIAVNLRGVFLTTKHTASEMVKAGKGGRIITVTSIDAIHPSMVGLAHYDASKHGAWGFLKNIALELAPHRITVNAIAPGGVQTPGVEVMQKQFAGGADISTMIETFSAGIPMKRFADPDEIGKVALFLASDMSSYMTGSQIVVDGGKLLT